MNARVFFDTRTNNIYPVGVYLQISDCTSGESMRQKYLAIAISLFFVISLFPAFTTAQVSVDYQLAVQVTTKDVSGVSIPRQTATVTLDYIELRIVYHR